VPTPRHASHAAIDPVETVTPPICGQLFDDRRAPAGAHGAYWLVLHLLFYAESGSDDAWRLFLFEIDGFVFVSRDAGANLRGGPSLLRLLVGVEAFLSAGGALGGVRGFIATVQAGVAQGAIAAAIAWELVDDARDLGRELIGVHLPRVAEVRSRQLGAVENRRQGVDIERGGGVIGGNVVGGVGPLRVAGGSEREDCQRPGPTALEKVLHRVPQLLSYGKPEIARTGTLGEVGMGPPLLFTFRLPGPPTPPIFEAKYVIAKGLRCASCCKYLILKSRFS